MKKDRKKGKILWIAVPLIEVAVYGVWLLAFSVLYGPLSDIARREIQAARDAREPLGKEEQRKQEALAYLEERYGEEFEIATYRSRGYAYDYVEMHAYPKGHSDEAHEFEIQGRRDKNKNMVYMDTYVMVKLTDEYKACVDEIVDEYFDDYKLFFRFESEWIFSNLPPDTTVEDLFGLRANVDYPLPHTSIKLKKHRRRILKRRQLWKWLMYLPNGGIRGK